MNDRERKKLGKYIRTIADAMGLRDWHLLLAHEPPESQNSLASCCPTFGQRRATLYFATDAFTWDGDRMRRVVVHELMHCHLDRMDTHYNTIAAELGTQAQRVSDDTWRSVLEDACDDASTAWAEALPRPEWSTT